MAADLAIYSINFEKFFMEIPVSQPVHVSTAWAANLPLTAQAYFCDTRSAALPLPLRSRSADFLPAPLKDCMLISQK